jgi:hypothetical protein
MARVPKRLTPVAMAATLALAAFAGGTSGAFAEPLAVPPAEATEAGNLDWNAVDWSALTAGAAPDKPGSDLASPKPGAPSATAIAKRQENGDGSASITLGRRLPTAWDSKVGIDLGTAPVPATTERPQPLATAPANFASGIAWANVTMPGLATPYAWDKATIDARLDLLHDSGTFGTTFSRSLPIRQNLSVTLQNNYALTQSLIGALPPHWTGSGDAVWNWSTGSTVRLNVLPSGTSLAAATAISSTDDKWLHSLSAEQKLFGGPLSITGSASETVNGEIAKSVTANFKRNW